MLLSLLRSEAEDVPASPAVADVTVSEAGYVEAGSPRASQQTSPVRFEKPLFCRQQSWLAFQKTRFFFPLHTKGRFFFFFVRDRHRHALYHKGLRATRRSNRADLQLHAGVGMTARELKELARIDLCVVSDFLLTRRCPPTRIAEEKKMNPPGWYLRGSASSRSSSSDKSPVTSHTTQVPVNIVLY